MSDTSASAPSSVRVSPTRLLARGLTRRCPRCGSRHLFRLWFKMVPDCPRCGMHFEREEGFFLGAFVINFAVTEVAIILLFIIGFAATLPDPPLWRLVFIGLALSVVVPLFTYPFSKTVWCAIDMIMRKTMGESYTTGPEGRQPGFRSRG